MPRTLSILACLGTLFFAPAASARMALIVAEPFGSFGRMMPQGHASIYLENLCVATPVRLRPCQPGELGAVISRYHDLQKPALDWLAFPLPIFLYGTPDVRHVLPIVTLEQKTALREAYRQQYLADLVPQGVDRHGRIHSRLDGDWAEGIGAAFDRRLLVYEFRTTPEQDAAMLAWINGRPNGRVYTVGRHNCADFAADLLRIALPRKAVRRNVLADFDMTTPKHLARQLEAFGLTHPERDLRTYEIQQTPGPLERSRPMRGAAESLITNRLYFAVVLTLQPELMLADWIIYERRGKWTPGLHAERATPLTWSETPTPVMVSGVATAPTQGETPDPDQDADLGPAQDPQLGP